MFIKTGLTLLLFGTLPAPAQTAAPEMEAWLARAITNLTYRPPPQSEFNQAKELFQRTLNHATTPAELKTRWADLGFELCELTADGQSLWLVREPVGKEFGRGWYLFRTNADSRIALEAPHARNDIHTGIIALRLFLAGKTRAFAASTITRHTADMARVDNSFFQAFTLAFAEACSTGLVIQLHGFESDNHDGPKADVIASAGTRSPEPWLNEAADQLKKASALTVLAFPRDTKQLGATLNIQGQALRKISHTRFLHLEMTKELRDRLTGDAALRSAILNCLPAAQTR